jgi:hypothetical protein
VTTTSEPDFRALPEHGGILHARLVVRGTERGCLVDQHDGDHVLDADVRHLAVVDYGTRAHPHQDLLHLFRVEGMLPQHDFERIERSLDGRSHCPLLDARRCDLVAFSEFVDERFLVTMRSIGQQEIVVSRHDVVDPIPAGLNQQRGGDPAARRHAAEDEALLDVVGIAIPRSDARGLLRGVIQQPPHLLGVELGGTPRRRGSAECAGDTMRALVSFRDARTKSDQDARANVVAEGNGAYEMHAADPELFSSGQRGGDNIAARMPASGPGIIRLVGVSEDPVGQRRLDGPAQDIRTNHHRNLLAAISAGETDGRAPRRQFGAGNHGRECIEDVVFCFFDHVNGKLQVPGFAHISAELGHDRAGGNGSPRGPGWKCTERQGSAHSLQYRTPRHNTRIICLSSSNRRGRGKER